MSQPVKYLFLFVFLFGFATACTKTEPATSQGVWKTSLKGALKLAEDKSKPVLIDFGADWCKPCKRMHQEVFVDPRIQEHLRESFVPVLIDATEITPEVSRLLQSYQVATLPSLVFLSPAGDFLEGQTLVGFSDVDRLEERIKRVLKELRDR